MTTHHRLSKQQVDDLPQVRCRKDPRGEHGLEGFEADARYSYQRVPAPEKSRQPYVRIWPDAKDHTYFHVCSEAVFRRFFAA